MTDQILHIVAVDDEPVNLMLLEELAAEEGLDIKTINDPLAVLEYIQSHTVDLLITDYMMPNLNGIELLRQCREITPDLLSIMITASDDSEAVKIAALEAGATDFLLKPLNVTEFQLRMRNLTAIKASQRLMRYFNQRLQDEVSKATADLKAREHETLQVLSKTAEYKDPETGSHIARVAHYSRMMAREYGLSLEEQELVFYASPLHDIGKVGIEDDILLKPGKLTPDEFETMKTHSDIGYEILRSSENPFLQAGAQIARSHHEKYDGSGYPAGLKGDEIPIFGRITAIADVFDALTSERPYKKSWSFEQAMEYITSQSGKHFDPDLVSIFVKNLDTVQDIFHSFTED